MYVFQYYLNFINFASKKLSRAILEEWKIGRLEDWKYVGCLLLKINFVKYSLSLNSLKTKKII